VIAVIGDLVVERVRRGMEPEHPVEPPARFVEQIRDAVRAGIAEGVAAIRERGSSSAFRVSCSEFKRQ
jgi:hypothetical protein